MSQQAEAGGLSKHLGQPGLCFVSFTVFYPIPVRLLLITMLQIHFVEERCQSAFIEKPNSEGKRLPCFIHCTEASWHLRSVYAGTLPLVLGAGFCCGWHGFLTCFAVLKLK